MYCLSLSTGSLLGDKTRMPDLSRDMNAYIPCTVSLSIGSLLGDKTRMPDLSEVIP